jgi:hypothetical protein
MSNPWSEKIDTLPQQQFTISNVALVSGASFNLTLAPQFDCNTSRLKVLGVGWLQALASMHSTRVQITAINGNIVTVTSFPSQKEDPENDGNVVVDLTLYQLGTAYFYRDNVLPAFWLDYWGF